MNTDLLDAAISAKKKGKTLAALKLYQQLYANEKSEKLEKSLFELEEEVVKKLHPNEEHFIKQAIENGELTAARDEIERLKQFMDLKVWPTKKKVECLKMANKTEEITQVLEGSFFLTHSEKLMLGQIYLQAGNGLASFALCQGVLSSAPASFLEGLKCFFQNLEMNACITGGTSFKLTSKGFNWLASFLGEDHLFTVSLVYLNVLHQNKNWTEGRNFLKDYLKRFPHESRFDWALSQFTWWTIVDPHKQLEISQKEVLTRLFEKQGMQGMFSQAQELESRLNRIMSRQGDENDLLLLEHDVFSLFGLRTGYDKTDIMQGMRQALFQKKLPPRVLLTLQRLLLEGQHNSLINFLHAPPFLFIQ